ncbi:PREDICTED: sialic acid-binding lectin-like [Nanorana parkeri]|uniref:sialic acid-binding lectin-like n=1 Tax=Nanorana parkeri TaxID=125878 RepID=UPI000854F074|nr:PREDICTED: sialic acid-binding lectin-like [Nanorana parkeri]
MHEFINKGMTSQKKWFTRLQQYGSLIILMDGGIPLSVALPSGSRNYNKFMEKHIVQDEENINCNLTISNRKLSSNNCRYHNTFIHDTNAKKIRAMCSPYTSPQVVSSSGSLRLTDCKLVKSPSATHCAYHQKGIRGIVYVTCENHVPVHFVRFHESSSPSWFPCIWNLVLLILLKELLLTQF